MVKFNSKTFYSRHYKELEKYIFNDKKTLHITTSKNNLVLDTENYQFLYIAKNEQILESVKGIKNQYDLIIITDLAENVDDITQMFNILYEKVNDNGKLLVTSINNYWYPILEILEKIKLKEKSKKSVYTSFNKLNNIIPKTKYVSVNYNTKQFIPFKLLGIGNLFNGFCEIILTRFNLGIKTYALYQKKSNFKKKYSKTIIIPAKNEEKNLELLINRIPKFENCQLIIACGKSKDNTLQEAQRIKDTNNIFDISIIEQTGKGKANAVFEAFELCSNDLVAILDADQSVDPETMSDFFSILENGEADFVNGTRFIYRMEKDSMRFFNVLGNKIFQLLISIVISKKLSDSLCGTKVFHRSLISKILEWQKLNIIPDPFGDFDLIFSAAYSGQSIVEFPIHYRSRVYGTTQISRFRDGFKLLTYFINTLLKFNSSNNRI